MKDNVSDEKSREYSTVISDAMRLAGADHVVDTKLTADVASYHAPQEHVLANIKEAERKLSSAKEHYFRSRFADAKKEVGEALRTAAEGGTKSSDSGPILVDAYILKGIVAKSTGDIAGARASFAEALKTNPLMDMSSAEYSPGIFGLFNDVRQEAASKPKGRIDVSAKPEAAEVLINGIVHGASPLNLELPVGQYEVTIRASKYKSETRTVNVPANGRVAVKESLRWQAGTGETAADIENDGLAHVREGLRISDILKSGKTILVNADASGAEGTALSARMVDGRTRASHRPVIAFLGADESQNIKRIDELVGILAKQAGESVTPGQYGPVGMERPIEIGGKKKGLFASPVVMGALIGAVAMALAGGITAAVMSKGSEGPGNLRVQFK